ncbi:MAG: sporulation transcriptional regulator SpoIIID [Clostridia bacterium]|nr:sporulation transcriptional regulator SpoIIID [Clostridia bacterium]
MTNSRILEFANFFIKQKSTIRKTANYFCVSKSAMHIYLHKKLKKIDYNLFLKVQFLLNKNNQEKHIRGGFATKLKYKN